MEHLAKAKPTPGDRKPRTRTAPPHAPNPDPTLQSSACATSARHAKPCCRRAVPCPTPLSSPWIERSRRRCLHAGLRPQERLSFDMVPRAALQRIEEANQSLLSAARPLLGRLGQAIADTRYFAILTNADGVVVDVSGNIDRSDRRADVIARVGVDLSERRVGTTAIGAALERDAPGVAAPRRTFF